MSKFLGRWIYFLEQKNLRILIINSVYFHRRENLAGYGKIGKGQLESIEQYLSNHNDDKIKIVLCHHHILPHERLNLGAEDLMVNGNELIDILNRYFFDLVIHGHKHEPLLRYAPGSTFTVPVFSVGSFSATTNTIITGNRNHFHLIKIRKIKNISKGNIQTWEFLPSRGWVPADAGENFFPVLTGFGYRGTIDTLVDKTENIINKSPTPFLDWKKFIQKLPDVQNLTPQGCLEFKNKLISKNIITHPKLPKCPIQIG